MWYLSMLIWSLIVLRPIESYLLNIEICLKQVYNLDWDFEGSLEKYYYCQALGETLNDLEKVFYNMQIKISMENAWKNLISKYGPEFSLTRLAMAKECGYLNQEDVELWKEVIQSGVKGYKVEQQDQQQPIGLQISSFEQKTQQQSSGISITLLIFITGLAIYFAFGLLLMCLHQMRTRNTGRKCGAQYDERSLFDDEELKKIDQLCRNH